MTTERKKDLMVKTRQAAYRRAKAGLLEVLQKGEVICDPSEETVRGPIRLRLKAKAKLRNEDDVAAHA